MVRDKEKTVARSLRGQQDKQRKKRQEEKEPRGKDKKIRHTHFSQFCRRGKGRVVSALLTAFHSSLSCRFGSYFGLWHIFSKEKNPSVKTWAFCIAFIPFFSLSERGISSGKGRIRGALGFGVFLRLLYLFLCYSLLNCSLFTVHCVSIL